MALTKVSSQMLNGNSSSDATVTGLGVQALNSNSGSNNTAVGYQSLYSNTANGNNTAVGYQALYSNLSPYNTAVGYQAGYSNAGGSITAVGMYALKSNTSGYGNVAVGGYDGNLGTYAALQNNTTGIQNVAVGNGALQANTTSSNNIAIGQNALYTNTAGTASIAIGYNACYYATNGNNHALGNYALYQMTTGTSNVAIGASAGQNGIDASYNVFIGTNAAYQITSGSGNISINSRTSSGTYSPVYGLTTENNRISLGSTGVTNAYVQVSWTVLSDARDKTNIADAPYGLDFVKGLRPVTYQWDKRNNYENKTPDGTHLEQKLQLGFLAQDVIALELQHGATPRDLLVGDDELEDSLKVTEAKLIPVLVKALQELNAKVDAQAAEIAALKAAK